MATKRHDRDAIRRATHIVSAVLDAWDPIGVGPDGPLGEYGDFVPRLLSFLRTGPDQAELSAWLSDWVRTDLDLEPDPHDALVVADLLRMWWMRNGHGLPAGVTGSDMPGGLP